MRAIVFVLLLLTVYSNSKYFVVNRTPPSVVETGPFTLVRPDYSGGGFWARVRPGQYEAMPPPPNIF